MLKHATQLLRLAWLAQLCGSSLSIIQHALPSDVQSLQAIGVVTL